MVYTLQCIVNKTAKKMSTVQCHALDVTFPAQNVHLSDLRYFNEDH